MTTATGGRGEESADIDPDLLAAARAIYGQRQDQKYGGYRRWRQFKRDYPQLAEAVQPTPAGMSETEVDIWRDARAEEERALRRFEYWARSNTSTRGSYYYRGNRPSVTSDAAGTGSPSYCRPYHCWDYTDRGRCSRSTGHGPIYTEPGEDDHIEHKVRGRNLLNLHVETDGGWQLEDADASRDNILEVCRHCGVRLPLPRDEHGEVVRKRGGQNEYCSPSCRREVKNARARAKRAEASQRKSPTPTQPVAPAELIARRWSAYGAGRHAGDTATPELEPGWDAVSVFWRFIPQPQMQTVTKLVQLSDTAWSISHPEPVGR